jgi:hypothetical protein
MGDFDVVHGLFTTGKPEFLRPVYMQRLHFSTYKKWILSKLVQLYECGTLLNKKPLFCSFQVVLNLYD